MSSFATPGKNRSKVKTELNIFTQDHHLTDDALITCKMCGVDPKDLYPKSVDSFTRKGMSESEAVRAAKKFESNRQVSIQLVQQHLRQMYMEGGRSSLKARSGLSDLALPKEDRVLRSAVRQPSHKADNLVYSNYQSTNMNQSMGFSNPVYVLHKSQVESKKFQEVLKRKEEVVGSKNRRQKDILERYFTKEQGRLARERLHEEDRQVHLEDKASKRQGVQEKKNAMEKARNKSMQQLENKMQSKFMSAAQRRAELLGLTPIIDKTKSPGKSQLGDNTCAQGNHDRHLQEAGAQLQRIQEHQAIQSHLVQLENRIDAATMQRLQQLQMKSVAVRHCDIKQKLIDKETNAEKFYHETFKNNVLKRKQIADKKKALAEDQIEQKEIKAAERDQKLERLRSRKAEIQKAQNKRMQDLTKKWQNMGAVKAGLHEMDGEDMTMHKELADQRNGHQKINVNRRKRIQTEYKRVIAEELMKKEMRKTMLDIRKKQLEEQTLRQNTSLRQQFFKTTQAGANQAKAQPWSVHQKEYRAAMINKKKQEDLIAQGGGS